MSSSTRQKILKAAHDLIIEGRDPDASMGAIAEAADVSRQAVYLHFESRTALLLALVDWFDLQVNIEERMRDVEAIEGARARLVGLLRQMMTTEPDLYDATIVFDAARHTDEAIATAFEDRMSTRRDVLTGFWQEVADDGLLRDGWSVDRAVEASWAMTTPGAYRSFVREAGWPLEEWVDFVIDVVESTILVQE